METQAILCVRELPKLSARWQKSNWLSECDAHLKLTAQAELFMCVRRLPHQVTKKFPPPMELPPPKSSANRGRTMCTELLSYANWTAPPISPSMHIYFATDAHFQSRLSFQSTLRKSSPIASFGKCKCTKLCCISSFFSLKIVNVDITGVKLFHLTLKILL